MTDAHPAASDRRSPRLSVVIPAFNNAAFLATTIDSILSQDYDDFELVIGDHSSTDETWQIMQRYADDPRVVLLRTEAGGGAQRNWQRVTDASRGEFVRLVPGDDVLYPGALRAHVEAFDAHPSAVAVTARRDIMDARGRVIIRDRGLQGVPIGLVGGRAIIRQTVRRGTNVFGEPMCVTLRRRALDAGGGWLGEFEYLIDQASYSSALVHGDIVTLPQTLAAFRVNSAQWSVALVSKQAQQAKAYHRWVRRMIPESVSGWDLWRGNRLAELAAVERRVFYIVFARRLRPAAVDSR